MLYSHTAPQSVLLGLQYTFPLSGPRNTHVTWPLPFLSMAPIAVFSLSKMMKTTNSVWLVLFKKLKFSLFYHKWNVYKPFSKNSLVDIDRDFTVVLLWGESTVPGDSPSARPEDNKPSHLPSIADMYMCFRQNERKLLAKFQNTKSWISLETKSYWL